PCTEARFRKAIQRAREELAKGSRRTHDQLAGLLDHLRETRAGSERIMIRTSERILFLKPEEIDHVEAAGNYVLLHSGKERHIVRETTAAMQLRLAPAGFMRISGSVIVNLSRTAEL